MKAGSNQKLGIVGQRGQITLDRKLAGKSVRITKIDTGRYIVEEMSLVPRSEAWAHSPKNKRLIQKGIAGLATLKKQPITNAAELEAFLKHVRKG
jgi:hypothetical protein